MNILEANDFGGKKRSELPDEVFGIPELRKYPMPDEKHTMSAIKLFNHVDKEHEEELAKAVIKNMKKYNIDPSVVGPNNRLRNYLPKDMIKESGIIFSRDDIYYNFEDFQNKKSNLVIVLGPSGSGKSTLSYQLAEQYNAELLSLDDFFYTHCADETQSDLCKKWLNSKLGKEYMDLKRSKVKIDRKYIMKYSDEVFKFIFNNVSKESKQYILEGMQITSMMTPEEIVKYPVIIKETSMLRTFYQRIRRDGNLGKGNIVQIIKWYQSSLDEINEVKDAMNESGIIFSGKDIYYNFEDFESKKNNILIVLGPSGSGKSTLSYQLADKYNAEVVCVDDFLYWPKAERTESDLCKLWLKTKRGSEYMAKRKNREKFDHDYMQKYADDVFKFIFSNASSSKQYILEGIDIAYYMKPEDILKYPVIIKETSMVKTLFRKYRRDGGFYGNMSQVIKWYKQEMEKINGVKDAMKESSEYLLTETESPIRNIVFDIGSVLIKCDFEKEFEKCKLIPEKYKEEVKNAWWFNENVTYMETCSKDEYIDMVTKRIISPEAKIYAKVMFELYMTIMKPYHFANKLVYDLKESGYNVYFLSNWDRWSSTALIEAGEMEFLKYMKGGIFSWEVQVAKPNKEIYLEFLSRFNLNPAECLFLDDKKKNVEGALKVGMKAMEFDPKTTPSFLYENYIHKPFIESMLSEYGMTAGTVVGSNQADSVYIVNYMKKNTFNPEPRLGICKYGMKDLHTKGGKFDRIHYTGLDEFDDEASDVKVFRYKGNKKKEFFDIVEDAESDKDFYEMLTGEKYRDIDDLRYNNLFEQVSSFIDTLKVASECTYATAMSKGLDLKEIPILMETVQGRGYNYYRDINGEFIKNEVTGLRSKSYKTKDDIPDAIRYAVISGVV